MYTYRIVLDAFNSHSRCKGARVVTYSRGIDRADALRKIGTVMIARDGTVSDGINPWPGSDNLPNGPIESRGLPEWTLASIRTVPTAGTPRIVWETESSH